MNLVKRIIWLFFYLPLVARMQVHLAQAAFKRFFNRPASQVKALGAGLAGGLRGGVKALRPQSS